MNLPSMNLNDLLAQILEDNGFQYFDDLTQTCSYTRTENGICVLRSRSGVLYYLTQVTGTSTIAMWAYGPMKNRHKIIDFASPESIQDFEEVLRVW